MAFTTEAIEAPAIARPTGPAEFDLPVREFVGYDPKGTTDITGSPIKRPEPQDAKQAPTTEAAAEPTPSEESVRLSPQLSAIARKEQALRRREQATLAREKELQTKLADADKYAQLKAKIASKDYSDAEELGLSYDEFVEYQLNKEKSKDPVEERLRSFEEKLTAQQRAQEEQSVREYEQNQALWKQEVAKVVSDNEAFSTIKELGLEHVVLQHINDSFDEDGVELTTEQAAQEIEDQLVARAEKFASVSKIKKKFEEQPKVLGAPKTSPKTITQNMTVTSTTKPSTKPFHQMSEAEQWAEATRRVQEARLQGR